MSLPTPISVLEDYFKHKLSLNDLSFWKEVSDDTWVDFAKTYLAKMEAGFTAEKMAERIDEQKIRLYFDYRYGEDYDREIVRHYSKTPLLGHSPFPAEGIDYGHEGLAQALAPLRKHLLVADELYIPDNFYRCFDAVADSYDRNTWRDDPNVASGVHLSVSAIISWLPMLAELRDLITTRAINFLPYYEVPSFPYIGGNPFMTKQMARLDIPPDPFLMPAGSGKIDFVNFLKEPNASKAPVVPTEPRLDCEGAIYAWINARLLGLDPVFPDKTTWSWASGIKFRDATKVQLTSDLMSIDILPLGDDKRLSVQDIMSMRKSEEVFEDIRNTLLGCKRYVQENVSEDASREFVRATCLAYIRDHLDPHERLKTLKFLDDNLIAGTVLSIAISAAFMFASPWVGLIVPVALTPKVALAIESKFDPQMRAKAQLEALL